MEFGEDDLRDILSSPECHALIQSLDHDGNSLSETQFKNCWTHVVEQFYSRIPNLIHNIGRKFGPVCCLILDRTSFFSGISIHDTSIARKAVEELKPQLILNSALVLKQFGTGHSIRGHHMFYISPLKCFDDIHFLTVVKQIDFCVSF